MNKKLRYGRAAGIVLCAAAVFAGPARGEDDVGRPWMVSEAALPAGFPGPGPVGEVIVKTYPAHRLARAAGKQGGNGAFMKLFRHIERNEIKMTAPVVMDWGDRPAGAEGAGGQPAAMAFLYAQPTLGAVGQDPADPLVVVADAPETVVASIGLRGAYDEATMKRGLEQLRAWLAKHPEWAEAGPPRSLAYNSPFVPWFAKYSEVQIPVARKADGKPAGEPRPE